MVAVRAGERNAVLREAAAAGRRALAVAEAITQAMKDANCLPGVGEKS